MRLHALVAAALCLALTGCPAPTTTAVSTGPYTNAPAAGPGTLGSLVSSGGVSSAEQALRDQLTARPATTFPARVGILFYNYSSALKPEDQDALSDQVRQELQATGLVRSALQIPAELVTPSTNFSSLRTLAARFQVDVLLVLSGSGGVQAAANPNPPGFWDAFGNQQGYYEAREDLSGLAVDVATGLFIASFDAAGQNGPVQVASDATFDATTYPLRKAAETQAIEAAKLHLVDALNALKSGQVN